MKRIPFLLVFIVCTVFTYSQPVTKNVSTVDTLLRSIADFQSAERQRDSLLRHPLGSNSEADFERRFRFFDSLYARILRIDTVSLPFEDQINLGLIRYDLEEEISAWKFRTYLNPILADEGFHTAIAAMGSQVLTTKAEFESYISRLKDIPRSVDERLELMRKGLKLGICQPRIILNGYQNTYEQHIVSDISKSVFWKPFQQRPFAISERDWARILFEGKDAVLHYAVEGFRKIKIFFDNEYLPGTRETIGVSNFPDGLAYYQDRVRHYTTTDLSYDRVFQIGMDEVARIRAEMMAVLKSVQFPGTLKEFIAFLRTDPRFYAGSAGQLLKEAAFIAKKADGLLPQFFGRLPRQPYGVEAVPAHLAPTYTAGRYAGAPLTGKRAASYWVNTYDLVSRPLYALESLTLHEAVPGHHLQIALAKELNDIPAFRRNFYVNAFGEGWGLYAEYLGQEMGFYKDPYSLFGRLTYEMWRACRLVVDVGLHARGWSRDHAVQYLAENTALSLHEVNTEINRYISWPGQALAYKIGELKIRELRKRAEEALGQKFDIRAFHDLVLSQGSVTLDILEKMVSRFILEQVTATK